MMRIMRACTDSVCAACAQDSQSLQKNHLRREWGECHAAAAAAAAAPPAAPAPTSQGCDVAAALMCCLSLGRAQEGVQPGRGQSMLSDTAAGHEAGVKPAASF